MHIVITGGAGFVGASLALFLKTAYPEYKITCLDNLRRRGSELNLIDLKSLGVTFVHGDIRNEEDLEQTGPFDVMIEASADPSVLSGLTGTPKPVITNNLIGSINCFNHCLENRARIIFISTSRVYPMERICAAALDELTTRFVLSETQSIDGVSPLGISEELSLEGSRTFYGSTKLASELLLREYEEFYGLDVAITRFGVIAGPRQMGKSDQGVVSLWLSRHYWQQPLKYIGFGGKGKQVRDILHIEDACRLVDLQLNHPQLFSRKVFNAGGGVENAVSLKEMSLLCQQLTGNSLTIEEEPETRPGDLPIYVTDNSRITDETGWRPTRSVQSVFEDTYNWIHGDAYTLQHFLK